MNLLRYYYLLIALLLLPTSAWSQNTETTDVTARSGSTRSHMHGNTNGTIRSLPLKRTIAAVLSLQPLPIDFGNIYSGRWEVGLVSSGLQLGTAIAGIVLIAENTSFDRHFDIGESTATSTWTKGKKIALYSLIGGYAITKLASSWIAIKAVSSEHFTIKTI